MSSMVPVKLTEIQSELDKLEEIHKQNNQLRASLFNLIVLAPKNDKLPFFLHLVDHIVNQFPCRIIFIEEMQEDSEPFLKASIAAKFVENSENQGVVCDKIYFESSKNNAEQLHHIILQYTLPNLPIYLLWGQDPTIEHPLLQPLKKMAQRLVFHSECSTNLQDLANKMIADIITCNWEVADLNWIHLEEWREVVKAIFSSKEAFEDLQKANHITLKFCGSESKYFCHNHFQVHYLHAWMASHLSWEFSKYEDQNSKKIVTYKSKSGPVAVEILEEKCDINASSGTVMHLQIKTSNNKIFTFQTASDKDLIHIEIVDEEKSKTPYNTSITKSTWEVYLAREICYKETSAHYIDTLKMLQKINGLI